MIDYEFYVNSYLGTAIPEKAFDALAAQAAGVLARWERIYQVEGTAAERSMALCAMAETLYAEPKRRRGVTAETVGSTSVRYDSGERAEKRLDRALYRQAGIYLRFYRGWKRVE